MMKMTPRSFALPVLAIVIFAMLPRAADLARGVRTGSCGSSLSNVIDPELRAAFAHFERAQSYPAARICALFRNSMP